MAQSEEYLLHPVRTRVVNSLSLVEDVIYSGLGILLALYAAVMLFRGGLHFWEMVAAPAGHGQIIQLLDEALMIFLVVELLYTVQVSFREHALVTEPFLIVGLISVIRRVLVLTAQVPELALADETAFRHAAYELILLALMIVVLVGALLFMQRQAREAARKQA